MRLPTCLALLLLAAPALASPAERWADVGQPSTDRARAIGGAAAGCLAGAAELAPEGEGYQVLRLERNRNWSHPRTVAFIQELARRAAPDGPGPLLVGDLSQPRGGPMAYGHGSHQNGLDVDIWFRLPGRPLSDAERARPQPQTMVKGTAIDARAWTGRHLKLLERAASVPEVDRIFVNPAIKAAACRQTRGDRAWLAKLRPWWGHDEHFHVRLSCPLGDEECTPQAAIPDGDGCGAELQSWLKKPTILPDESKDKPNHRRPALPGACTAVLDQPSRIPAALR